MLGRIPEHHPHDFFGTTNAAKLKHRPAGVVQLVLRTLAVQGTGAVAQRWIGAAVAARLPVLWLAGVDTAVPEAWAERVQRVANAQALVVADACLVAPGAAAAALVMPTFTLWPETHGAPVPGQVSLHLIGEDSRLLEIIHDGTATAAQLAHAMDLAQALRKVPIVVKTQGASYLGRVQAAYQEHVDRRRAEGIPTAVINHAARKAGMRRLPLATTAPAAPVRTLPDAWAEAREQAESIRQELLMVQAEAALACLEDGLVDSALDADIAAVLGMGFPDALGGPLGYIDTVGAGRYLDQRQAMTALAAMSPQVRQRLESMRDTSAQLHPD